MVTGNTGFIYWNELDKAFFQHGIPYGKSKAFKIASDSKYDGYQRRLAPMVFKFLDKKDSSGSCIANEPNYQLAN